jgi:hypothetical protein
MMKHKFYQLMKSSHWNYITNITHIHMKKSTHINESIPVTITHVKENRKTVKKREKKKVLCVHDDHVGYIYKFMQ